MDNNFDLDLDDLLDQIAESPDLAENMEEPEHEQIEGIAYMNFLQANSTLDGHEFVPPKTVAIGQYKMVDDSRVWEGVVLKGETVKFFIVDPILIHNGSNKRGVQYIGGRVMWKHDPISGKQDMSVRQPICKSSDGLNPHKRYIDTPVIIPQNRYPGGITNNGQGHFIGRRLGEDGTSLLPVAVDEICKTCPMSQWAPWGWTGGDSKPLCRDSWDIVVFFPPQDAFTLTGDMEKPLEKVEWEGGLAVLQGQNMSIQMAMMGRKPGESLGAADGGALPGIMTFRQSNGTNTIAVPKDKVTQSQFRFVIGMAKGNTTNPDKVTSFDGLDTDQKSELFDSEDFKYAVLQVRTYPWAQNGLVEHIGSAALDGLNYLSFDLVLSKNDYGNQTYVPRFKLLEESDPEKMQENYVRFFRAYKEYYESGRDKIMRFADNREAIMQHFGVASQQLLSSGDMPQLTDGNTEEGDFEDISDM